MSFFDTDLPNIAPAGGGLILGAIVACAGAQVLGNPTLHSLEITTAIGAGLGLVAGVLVGIFSKAK
jgi:hypothetical protein